MLTILLSFILLILTGFTGLFRGSHPSGGRLAALGVAAAAVTGITGVTTILLDSGKASWSLATQFLPCGRLILQLDWFSGVFMIIMLLLALFSVCSGWGLKNHTDHGSGNFWFFFNLLIASMMLILLAGDAVIFLLGWEGMAISSFFLVIWEPVKEPDDRRTGWIYLVASHLSFFPLLAFFCLLSAKAGGSMAFSDLALVRLTPTESGILFVMALIGFGTKADMVGVHAWLPTAYAAAPGMVPAIMSGAMTKIGIYGFLRAIGLLGAPSAWWGWVLVALGCIGGLYGVLMALGQNNLKRILAYSTVENIGIIFIGLGIGLTAISQHCYVMAAIALAGAIFHAINHSLFKGLLFQAVYVVITMTRRNSLEAMGGLQQRMPVTGVCTMAGSAAVSGLPPFNGFISEFLIYYAAFMGVITSGSLQVLCLVAIASLALIGGLALTCFCRLYGTVFCGAPRSADAAATQEAPWLSRLPLMLGMALCLLLTLAAPWLTPICWRTIMTGMRIPLNWEPALLDPVLGPLTAIAMIALAFMILIPLFLFFRFLLLRKRQVTRQETWGCGFFQSSARVQYTGTGLAQPVTEFFRPLLGIRDLGTKPQGFFPGRSSWRQNVSDFFLDRVWAPVFAATYRFCLRIRPFQDGRVQVYILYIVIMILALLIWTLA